MSDKTDTLKQVNGPTVTLYRKDVIEIQSLLSWLRYRGWKLTDEDDKEIVRLLDAQLKKALKNHES